MKIGLPKATRTLNWLLKLWLWVCLLLVLLWGSLAANSQAAPPWQAPAGTAGIPTNDWAVQLTPEADPDAVAAQYGFQNLGQIGTLTNFYLFRRPVIGAANVQGLEREARVLWSEQQVARQQHPRPVPSDPLYGDQWHLHNTGQSGGTPGQDVNILPVWSSGITGSGVVVAVVDDGLQYTHPDFSGKYLAAGSYDFNGHDSNPAPGGAADSHGTAAAGVAVAGNEGTCGVGSAFGAQVSGLRLIAGLTTDADEAAALTYQFQLNDIYNNSWGPFDDGQRLEGPGLLTQATLQNGVTQGRGGLGNIYVWAAGNGLGTKDNVNYDGYANSRYVIAVAAVDHDGHQSAYSEPGAPLLVTAPSSGDGVGITTTDRVGTQGYSLTACTNNFGGTSSAAPLVSGIIALMLQANPNLSWRDVQHILVQTAVQNDPGDGDWTTNGAGHPINHKYGFGRIDANSAVNAAMNWVPVGPVSTYDSGLITVNRAIPDNDPAGVTSIFTVNQPMKLEHVEVVFEAKHLFRGDLQVVLTSPSGVQSILAALHDDPNNNYDQWRFMTVRHWDEPAQGFWSLKVVDQAHRPVESGGDTGIFNSWRLILSGTVDDLTLTKAYLPFVAKKPAGEGKGFINGDFEQGQLGWSEFSLQGYPLIGTDFPAGATPHSGSQAAWLGGVLSEIAYIQQRVTIPTYAPYLAYWHWIASEDDCGYDFGMVLVNNTAVDVYSLCSAENTQGWVKHVVDLSDYSGQTVEVQIRAEFNSSKNSNLFVDDVSFQPSLTVAGPAARLETGPEIAHALKP